MRKAGSTYTLAGLALALAGLLNAGLLPVYSKGETRTVGSWQWAVGSARNKARSSLATASHQAAQANASSTVTAKIAFSSDRDGNFEIYTMDADGSNLSRLTENTAEDFSPAWSPDGTRLAFVSNRDGNTEIYSMNADGTSQTRLTNNSSDDLNPAWSPDGTRIAFTSRRDGHDQIYLMNADGSGQSNISNSTADDSFPTFSPSGLLIAFASTRDTGRYQIYRMDTGGNGVTRLTMNDANDSNPTWSSPGKITFQSDRDGNEEIYMMNGDGSGQTDISNNPAFDVNPFVTSDDSKVVFASTRGGDFEIYLMNADGTGVTRLTNNPATDFQPALQLQGTIPVASTNTVQFSATNYTVSEGGVIATITVTRTGATTSTASVDYATSDGTASNKGDYSPALGTLHFNAGETSKTFTVSIIDDAYIEADETVNLTLRNPVGVSLGSPATATLTILDNDSALLSTNPNPIDNAAFFIRQQYLDFLNREPDPTGFAGWQNILNNCAFGDPSCDRITVSSDFYRSPEFQDRGSFVYHFYSVAFGRIPHYAEFLPDLSRVTGFQSASDLEASKQAFTNDFVQRPEFVNRYGAITDPTAYVNALCATAGVTPSNKQQLINDLAAGRKSRADVLRAITESPEVAAKFFNEAFVVMEYFGYLHRDPDALFVNWLNLLNQTGDFRTLVNGFVNSQEYRQRFGPP